MTFSFPSICCPRSSDEYPKMLDSRPKAPMCDFLRQMWNNIISDQKLCLAIGSLAVMFGVLGLVGTLGMSSLISAGLIAGGGALITKGLCDAVPKCGGDRYSKYQGLSITPKPDRNETGRERSDTLEADAPRSLSRNPRLDHVDFDNDDSSFESPFTHRSQPYPYTDSRRQRNTDDQRRDYSNQQSRDGRSKKKETQRGSYDMHGGSTTGAPHHQTGPTIVTSNPKDQVHIARDERNQLRSAKTNDAPYPE